MPKLKTKQAAAKRFKVLGSGRIKRAKANLRHLLTHKSTKRKRGLRGTVTISPSDEKSIRQMLPHA
jgi:large subunit ribosomal protein L35